MVGITGTVTVKMPEVLALQMCASLLCYIGNFKVRFEKFPEVVEQECVFHVGCCLHWTAVQCVRDISVQQNFHAVSAMSSDLAVRGLASGLLAT
jgi:hypothetical protein